MRSTTRATAAFAALVLAGCAAEPKPTPQPFAPRPVVEVARWQVLDGTEPVGYLLHLEIRDPQGAVPYYRIEDLDGRWIGHATEQGRFSRRVPFQDGEEDLGVWSLATGAGKLLEAKAKVELKPVAAEASARKQKQ